MRMLLPSTLAERLLTAFRKPLLCSLWRSLAPLLYWLRAAFWWPDTEKGQQQVREEPEESQEEEDSSLPITPTSVNYHFTRQCNYRCGFCFHTAKTSFVLPLEEAKRGLLLLKEAGMEKINFSGGEPFLQDRGQYLGQLVRFCKQELLLPSVSIVSNGSLIREKWFRDYGEYLDILAISCDSFDEEVNVLIGRGQGKKNHVENLQKLRKWCQDYRVAFKINSVINRFNVDEDMNEQIKALNPVRWKMKDSYLILDEYMRFLNCRNGRKDPSMSILDVGVEEAIKFSGFDERMFLKRGGKYVWSKADLKLDW
ncbi:Radical S-adenosyl methionine domain-containing protein 2 [Sciurus carolinensis]|uniref:Radical S-adenosyl methionine domain-containing protein 2 n=1 Tax=Sciurus carolinensis TaxID=30640 RepID=A0AA41T649_SCICA|nr:Radical S-adenosyl methionine domain-containing protein 2 [Sciurus carolinensis]